MSEGERREHEHEVESSGIAYVHRRLARLLFAMGGAVAASPIVGLVVAAIVGDGALARTMAGMLGHALGAGALAGAFGLKLAAFPGTSAGVVRREGEALAVRLPARAFAVAPARTGVLVPSGMKTRAELTLANGDMLHVDAPDFAAAVEVLRVAGVDATQQHARFRVDDLITRGMAALVAACVLGVVTLPIGLGLMRLASALAGGLIWAGVVAGLTWLGMDFIGLPEITVGTDGISYKRGPFRRFIPLADVKEVRSSDVTLYVHLRDGRIKMIRSLTGADPGRAYSLELRVREALAARRGEHAPAQLELLDRKGRSVSDWSAALQGLSRAGSSYRAAGLSADDLAAIVVSPDVTPERRIGAALALRGAGDPAAPERIRVAAAQCASGRVRIALERVGAGEVDHAAIDEALAETEAEAEEERARARG